MPAWMTSEFRELVCVPMASSASRTTTSRPDRARARATARPTTPAPRTTASTFSMRGRIVFAAGRNSGGSRPRAGGPAEYNCRHYKMTPSAIYSKSGKGVQEASGKTSILSRGDRAVLSAFDGKLTLGEVAERVGKPFDAKFEQLVTQL